MLTSFDPFRDLDRLTEGMFSRRNPMPVDAYRHGDEFVVAFDLPGIDPSAVDVTVEKNVLTVTAERRWAPEEGDEVLVAERPQGRYSRQLFLGDNLETDSINASYDQGVLTLRIPVSERARPRKVEIKSGAKAEAITASSQRS